MKAISDIALNGCDIFMLAMDRSMRRTGSKGNVCHLLVTLPVDTDIIAQGSRLIRHETFQAITSLRLSKPIFRAPRWIARGASTTSPSSAPECRSERDLHSIILSRSVDARTESPFGVVFLPRYEQGPSLLFYWHHALCDAHGAELLIGSFGVDGITTLPSPKRSDTSMKDRLPGARRATRMIFNKARGSITRLAATPNSAPDPAFHKVIFSAEQTRRIDQMIQRLTGGMFPTALLLAATARAVASARSARTTEEDTFFVPVPYDIRRSSKERSPISNQISMAFFRIRAPLSQSLIETTNGVIQQLHDTIAEGHQRGMLDFLHLIRLLPSSLLWRVIEHPTKGHPASFYLSDIGASLSTLEVFGGVQVARATHYPPVLSPPGFTTVWSRYRNAIELTICYDKSVLDEATIARISEHLTEELTGASYESRAI